MQIFHSFLRFYSTCSLFPGIYSVKWIQSVDIAFGLFFFSPCQTRSHKSAAGCYRGEMSEIFFMKSLHEKLTECSWCVWSPGSLTSHKWPYQKVKETTFTWRKSFAWRKIIDSEDTVSNTVLFSIGFFFKNFLADRFYDEIYPQKIVPLYFNCCYCSWDS